MVTGKHVYITKSVGPKKKKKLTLKKSQPLMCALWLWQGRLDQASSHKKQSPHNKRMKRGPLVRFLQNLLELLPLPPSLLISSRLILASMQMLIALFSQQLRMQLQSANNMKPRQTSLCGSVSCKFREKRRRRRYCFIFGSRSFFSRCKCASEELEEIMHTTSELCNMRWPTLLQHESKHPASALHSHLVISSSKVRKNIHETF